MSDVIRRAIIEIETRQKKSRLEAPGAADAGFKAHAEAATKAEAATSKAEAATKRMGETSQVTSRQMAASFREGGEGALRMARGIAFLAASGSDDMKKLAQSVLAAQAAFDVAAGSLKAFTSLSAALGGAAAGGITAIAAGAALASAAFIKFKHDVEESIEAVNAQIERGTKIVDAYHKRLGRIEEFRQSRAERRIDIQVTEAGRQQAIREALTATRAAREAADADIIATDGDLNRPGARRRSAEAHGIAAGRRDDEINLLKKEHEIREKLLRNQQQAISGVTNFAVVGAGVGLGAGGLGLAAGAAEVGTSRATKAEHQLTLAIDSLSRTINKLFDEATKLRIRQEQLDNSLSGNR